MAELRFLAPFSPPVAAHQWSLDETTGSLARDSGFLAGETVASVGQLDGADGFDGRAGGLQGLLFNGTQRVTLGVSQVGLSSGFVQAPFSITAKVALGDLTDTYSAVLLRWAGTGEAIELSASAAGSYRTWAVRIETTGSTIASGCSMPAAMVAEYTWRWTTITLTLDAVGTAMLYLDGALGARCNVVLPNPVQRSMYIGSASAGTSPFRGRVRDVRFYPGVVLSPTVPGNLYPCLAPGCTLPVWRHRRIDDCGATPLSVGSAPTLEGCQNMCVAYSTCAAARWGTEQCTGCSGSCALYAACPTVPTGHYAKEYIVATRAAADWSLSPRSCDPHCLTCADSTPAGCLTCVKGFTLDGPTPNTCSDFHVLTGVAVTATAASSEGSSRAFAVDGLITTFWETDGVQNPPHWINFDLGATYTLKGVSMMPRTDADFSFPGNGMPQDLEVYTSLADDFTGDGSAEPAKLAASAALDVWQRESLLLFAAVKSARYVRLRFTKSLGVPQDFFGSIKEVGFYVPLNAPVAAHQWVLDTPSGTAEADSGFLATPAVDTAAQTMNSAFYTDDTHVKALDFNACTYKASDGSKYNLQNLRLPFGTYYTGLASPLVIFNVCGNVPCAGTTKTNVAVCKDGSKSYGGNKAVFADSPDGADQGVQLDYLAGEGGLGDSNFGRFTIEIDCDLSATTLVVDSGSFSAPSWFYAMGRAKDACRLNNPIACSASASSLWGAGYTSEVVTCPGGCAPQTSYAVYGTADFKDTSSICRAAHFAFLIGSSGGEVRVTRGPGGFALSGGSANGVATASEIAGNVVATFRLSGASVDPYLVLHSSALGGLGDAAVQLAGAISVSFKMQYPDPLAIRTSVAPIFDFGDGNPGKNFYLVHMGGSTHHLMVTYISSVGWAQCKTVWNPSEVQRKAGRWVQITTTIDQYATTRIYVDGALGAQCHQPGLYLEPVSRSGMYIGTSSWGAVNPSFNGRLRDLRVYPGVVLQPHEISPCGGALAACSYAFSTPGCESHCATCSDSTATGCLTCVAGFSLDGPAPSSCSDLGALRVGTVRATASSSNGTNAAPTLAVDGDRSTAWCSSIAATLPQQIVVDLGAVYTLKGILLHQANATLGLGQIQGFEVRISLTNSFGPLEVAGTFDGYAEEKLVAFPQAKQARYIHVSATSSLGDPPNKYACLAEFTTLTSFAPPVADHQWLLDAVTGNVTLDTGLAAVPASHGFLYGGTFSASAYPQALRFNGAEYVKLLTSKLVANGRELGGAFSLTAKVMFDSLDSPGQCLLDFGNGAPMDNLQWGTSSFNLHTGMVLIGSAPCPGYTGQTLQPHRWYQLGLTYDPATAVLTLYADTTIVKVPSVPQLQAVSRNSMLLGVNNLGSAFQGYFNGKMRDVRLYTNRVLHASEVQACHAACDRAATPFPCTGYSASDCTACNEAAGWGLSVGGVMPCVLACPTGQHMETRRWPLQCVYNELSQVAFGAFYDPMDAPTPFAKFDSTFNVPPPLAHLKFDEGGGTIARDSVGTNHAVAGSEPYTRQFPSGLTNWWSPPAPPSPPVSAWTDRINSVATSVGTASGGGASAAVPIDFVNKALTFDGTKQLQVTASPVSGLKDFTVVVAFSTTIMQGGARTANWWTNVGLVDAYASSGARDWGLALDGAGGISGGISSVTGRLATFSDKVLPKCDDGLVHTAALTVSVTTTGTTVALYLDGNLATTASNNELSAARSTSRFVIGSIADNSHYFSGKIYDILIFDRALAYYEILKTNVVLHMLAWWNADDVSKLGDVTSYYASYYDSTVVSNPWYDRLDRILADVNYTTSHGGLYTTENGVMFEASQLQVVPSPVTGRSDFSVLVTFTADGVQGVAPSAFWYNQTGLVAGDHPESPGLDWALTINNANSVTAGYGLPAVLDSGVTSGAVPNLYDGHPHTAVLTVEGLASTNVSVYLDDLPPVHRVIEGAAAAPRTGSRFTIGSMQANTGYFRGLIHEVVIFDRALTAAEAAIAIQDTMYFKPLVQYTFDEGAGTTAADTGRLNAPGAILGSMWTQDGLWNSPAALFSAASDQVAVSAAPGPTMAVSLWLKTSFAQQGSLYALCQVAACNTNVPVELYLTASGLLSARFQSGEAIASTGPSIADGAWHHVVYTYGGLAGGQTVYLDATVVARGTQQGPASAYATVSLGYSAAAGSYKGIMEDARVFSHALDAPQVVQLTTAGMPSWSATGARGGSVNFLNGGQSQFVMPWPYGANPYSVYMWVKTTKKPNGYLLAATECPRCSGKQDATMKISNLGRVNVALGSYTCAQSVTITDGKWHHVGWGFVAGSQLNGWTDGAWTCLSAGAPGFSFVPTHMRIGWAYTPGTMTPSAFVGSLDELQFFTGQPDVAAQLYAGPGNLCYNNFGSPVNSGAVRLLVGSPYYTRSTLSYVPVTAGATVSTVYLEAFADPSRFGPPPPPVAPRFGGEFGVALVPTAYYGNSTAVLPPLPSSAADVSFANGIGVGFNYTYPPSVDVFWNGARIAHSLTAPDVASGHWMPLYVRAGASGGSDTTVALRYGMPPCEIDDVHSFSNQECLGTVPSAPTFGSLAAAVTACRLWPEYPTPCRCITLVSGSYQMRMLGSPSALGGVTSWICKYVMPVVPIVTTQLAGGVPLTAGTVGTYPLPKGDVITIQVWASQYVDRYFTLRDNSGSAVWLRIEYVKTPSKLILNSANPAWGTATEFLNPVIVDAVQFVLTLTLSGTNIEVKLDSAVVAMYPFAFAPPDPMYLEMDSPTTATYHLVLVKECSSVCLATTFPCSDPSTCASCCASCALSPGGVLPCLAACPRGFHMVGSPAICTSLDRPLPNLHVTFDYPGGPNVVNALTVTGTGSLPNTSPGTFQSASWTWEGLIGPGISFGSTGLPNTWWATGGVPHTMDCTVAVWFKTATANAGLFVVGNDDLSAVEHQVCLDSGDIKLNNNGAHKTSGLALADNRWHFLGYTYASGTTTQQVFVDGRLSADLSIVNAATTTQPHLLLGYACGTRFVGVMEDLNVWVQPLPASTAVWLAEYMQKTALLTVQTGATFGDYRLLLSATSSHVASQLYLRNLSLWTNTNVNTNLGFSLVSTRATWSDTLTNATVTETLSSSANGSCGYALGMGSGAIGAAALAYSSRQGPVQDCSDGRLEGAAWCPATTAWPAEWIMIDVGATRTVTAIATQGRASAAQWVTGFDVHSSLDGETFSPVGTFVGNSDQNTVAYNVFSVAVSARFFRVVPRTFSGHPSMRIELYGCPAPWGPAHVTYQLDCQGSALQLLYDGIPSLKNRLVYNLLNPGVPEGWTISFSFFADSKYPGMEGAGLSLSLLPTDTFGRAGAIWDPFNATTATPQMPRFPGVLGFGFPYGGGAFNCNVVWDGNLIANVGGPRTGFLGAWHRVSIDVIQVTARSARVTVGWTTNICAAKRTRELVLDTLVAMRLYEARLMFYGVSTVYTTSSLYLRNVDVNIDTDSSPSPSWTPTISVTSSLSHTRSATKTRTVTPSVSSTPSVSPTSSVTPSVSPTSSATPSASPTPSMTPSVSRTSSVTPSVSPTPSPVSVSSTPSISVSVTPSVTPSVSATTSVTPTVSPTSSVTPTVSPTASVTPTTSPTPSVTPSTSPLSLSTSPSISVSPSVSDTPSPTRPPTASPSPSTLVCAPECLTCSSNPVCTVCRDGNAAPVAGVCTCNVGHYPSGISCIACSGACSALGCTGAGGAGCIACNEVGGYLWSRDHSACQSGCVSPEQVDTSAGAGTHQCQLFDIIVTSVTTPCFVRADQLANATLNVTLSRAPTNDVTLIVDSSDLAKGVVLQSSVTLNALTWASGEVITVMGVPNVFIDGAVSSFYVNVHGATSADPHYHGHSAPATTVYHYNAATPAISFQVIDTGAVAVEGGVSATYFVSMAVVPTGPLTATVASTKPAVMAVVLGSSLSFTASTWYIPQQVVFSALEDMVAYANDPVIITVSAPSPHVTRSFGVPRTDNDVAGLVYNSTVEVSESGQVSTVFIRLKSQPIALVSVSAVSSATAVAEVTVGHLIFSPANWSVVQPVVVKGVRGDAALTADRTFTVDLVTRAAGAGSAAQYDSGVLWGSISGTCHKIYFPAISDLRPRVSPLLGGWNLTVTAQYLKPGASVSITQGAVTRTSVYVAVAADQASLRFMAPAMPVTGDAVLHVTNPDGGSADFTDLYYTDDCPQEGMFGQGADCIECPFCGVCKGGIKIYPAAGCWGVPGTASMYQCNPPDRCLGGATSECAAGYTGRLCGSCAPGYYKEADSCVQCGDPSVVVLLVIVDAVYFGLLTLAMLFLGSNKLAAVLTLVAILQNIRAVGQAASSRMPYVLRLVYSYLALTSFDISFLRSSCTSLGSGYKIVFWGNVLLAAALVLPFVISAALLAFFNTTRRKFWIDRLLRGITIYGLMLYLVISTRVFEALYCIKVAGQYVMLSDPDATCSGGAQMGITIASAVLLFVFVLGYPLGSVVVLFRLNKKNVLYTERSINRFGYVYEALKPTRFWFAAAPYLQLLLLALASAVQPASPVAQFALSVAAFGLTAFGVMNLRPYKSGLRGWMAFMASMGGIVGATLNFIGSWQLGLSVNVVSYITMAVVCVLVLALAIAAVVILRRRRELAKVDPAEKKSFDVALVTSEPVRTPSSVGDKVAPEGAPTAKPAWTADTSPLFEAATFAWESSAAPTSVVAVDAVATAAPTKAESESSPVHEQGASARSGNAEPAVDSQRILPKEGNERSPKGAAELQPHTGTTRWGLPIHALSANAITDVVRDDPAGNSSLAFHDAPIERPRGRHRVKRASTEKSVVAIPEERVARRHRSVVSIPEYSVGDFVDKPITDTTSPPF